MPAQKRPEALPVAPPSAAVQLQLVRAADLIRSHQRFLVTAHAHPDGDAVGGSLALYHMLRRLGKEVVLFNVDRPPYNFAFLPGCEAFTRSVPASGAFDVTCVLDCPAPQHLGPGFPTAAIGRHLLVIDHHANASYPEADVHLRDENASAVGELLYFLAGELGVEIDATVAECLYCSLLADTGGFRYSCTTSVALSIASDLVDRGVDVWRMSSFIFEDYPAERIQLLGKVLRTLWVSACGHLACIRVTRRMLREADANEEILDGFINHARSVRGVDVAAQLVELGPRRHRVTFRSRGPVDVAALAARFGGGGSHNAAGCIVTGHWREVQQRLADALTAMLAAKPSGPPRGPR